MIPAGYMAKRVTVRPSWLKAGCVEDVYSVSGCISEDFTDYVKYWKHNGYWFFDSPEIITQLARDNSLDLTGTNLFFYEVYELEFDDTERRWCTFQPEASFTTQVAPPLEKTLEGYDVVTFYVRTKAQCSPLSCNSLANEIEINQHCLLPSLDRAKELLDEGKFNDAEPGARRIFAVYFVNWP